MSSTSEKQQLFFPEGNRKRLPGGICTGCIAFRAQDRRPLCRALRLQQKDRVPGIRDDAQDAEGRAASAKLVTDPEDRPVKRPSSSPSSSSHLRQLSSAENGSSSKIACGSDARIRASATRCCGVRLICFSLSNSTRPSSVIVPRSGFSMPAMHLSVMLLIYKS